MISYLKGHIVNIVKNNSNRLILTLEVNCIGYEIQIPNSFYQQLEADSSAVQQIFTHLQIQEDKQILYGFATAAERDLFRQLVGVSGIGMQLAIALIDTLGLSGVVRAIIQGDIPALTKTPGVGKKTAERIALELKTKLAQWRKLTSIDIELTPTADNSTSNLPTTDLREELEMTLLALGYSPDEIAQAIAAISQNELLQKTPHVEEWIRSAIEWLSG